MVRGVAALALCSLAGLVAALSHEARPPLVDLGDRNASQLPGDQGEVSIAVDSDAPLRVVAAAMNVDQGPLLTMASDDGGETWTRSVLPLEPEEQLHADPMVAFDARGVAHLAYIPVATRNQPLGIDLRRSSDGGATWSPPLRISKATGRDDKLTLAVDDGPESPFRDRIYVAWKWPSGGIYFSYSSDGGGTFTRRRLIDVAVVSGLDLAVTAEGTVCLAASDGPGRKMRSLCSADGGRSFSPSVAVAPVRALWYTRQPSHCNRTSLVHASLAADRSSGSRRGLLYLTWADYAEGGDEQRCREACGTAPGCHTRVFFSRSSDTGRTWSAPLPLPDQTEGSDRYFQWARTDPADGTLYVAYKDTRLDPSRVGVDVWLSRSSDGGLTWEPPIRASSASSDASRSSFQFGDYQGLAVAWGRVYPAWSDYRSDAAGLRDGEIYVGRLLFSNRAQPTRGATSRDP
jgi:hypothetical protein